MFGVKLRFTTKISLCAVFSSVAAAISILRIEIPFPILTWLKIDFAEIPDMMAFFIGGLYVGIITSLIHMIILNLTSEFPIIGPLAKFLAVISMMIGISIANRLKTKNYTINNAVENTSFHIYHAVFALITRVIVMTGYNIVIFILILPDLLNYLPAILKPYFGLEFTVSVSLFITLIITGLYNVMHAVLSIYFSKKIVDKIGKVFLLS